VHFTFVSDVNQVLQQALGEPIAGRRPTTRIPTERPVAVLGS
jgi:hypothetical protein